MSCWLDLQSSRTSITPLRDSVLLSESSGSVIENTLPSWPLPAVRTGPLRNHSAFAERRTARHKADCASQNQHASETSTTAIYLHLLMPAESGRLIQPPLLYHVSVPD
jgi:hypothetical protein